MNVHGRIKADSQYYVPGASVNATCSATQETVKGFANSMGYYSLDMLCLYNTQVIVYATADSDIKCPDVGWCIAYGGGKGTASGTFSGGGSAAVDVVLTPL